MTHKHEIKNRLTGEVLFTCDIPEGMESGMIERHALETAIAEGENLWGANLRGANLWGANLEGAKNTPLIITGLRWPIHISGTGKMRIGCQEHSVEAWKNFNDVEIRRMDIDALEFWNKHKGLLLKACEDHVHTIEVEA